MDQRSRTSLVAGLLLIVIGGWFLITRLVPSMEHWFAWPLVIIGVGVFLLLLGLLTRVPGMAVPACVVAGIGGILYYQNISDNWSSWSYIWALIPGFVGVGLIVAGLLGERPRESFQGGSWLILISAVLFLIFGSFLGGFAWLGPYWPVAVIAVGVLILVRSLLRI